MRTGHLLKRLRQFSANAQLVESGRKLVEEGIYAFNGFPDVKVDLFADWTADPVGNRSWQWNTASFNFMPSLLGYHQTSSDARALAFAIAAIESWCAAVPRLSGYEFANHDHATALRAENSLYLMAYLINHKLAVDARPGIRRLIMREAARLAQDEFYSAHTNHGIEQSRILAFVAHAFPKAAKAGEWWDLALARLEKELAFAFTREGVHVENSPAYHVFVCNAFLKAVYALPEDRTGPLRRAVDKVMIPAMRYTTHIVRPDGLLPIIGDTQHAPPMNCFHPYAAHPAFRELLFSTSGGRDGVAPGKSVAAFPESGYLVVRDRWGASPKAARAAFHLIMKCGWHSSYHRHDDDFSVVLFYGEDWLVDGGLYSYVESDPVRRYLRSKWAHNVCVIDADGDRWDFRPRNRLCSSLNVETPIREPVRAVATTSAYPGYRAQREIEVHRNRRSFSVHDSIQPVSARSGEVQFRSLWHLPADKKVYFREGEVLVVSPTSNRAMLVRSLGEPFDGVRLLDPAIGSVAGAVYSPAANELRPCRILSFDRRALALSSSLSFEFIDGVEIGDWIPAESPSLPGGDKTSAAKPGAPHANP